MGGRTYGYVRVSTKSQNEDRQVIALREYGVAENYIVVEKQSGKNFDRPLYQELIKKLQVGDTLVIQSLDRLGRDYTEIQEQWRIISKELGVAIVVLDMPLLCTQENQELINRLITDLVLQLFSFVAQTERENTKERQRQGIDAAKERGVNFGRPRTELPEGFSQVAESWDRGDFTAREAARMLGMSRSTFFRRLRELFMAEGVGQDGADCADGTGGACGADGAERMDGAASPDSVADGTDTAVSTDSVEGAAAADSADGTTGAVSADDTDSADTIQR